MQYLCLARADYSDVLRCGKKELPWLFVSTRLCDSTRVRHIAKRFGGRARSEF
ncbi:hypothetical protein [Labrys neptuniae]